MLPPLAEHIELTQIRVQAPTPLIFLCGGKLSDGKPEYTSMRDGFLKIPDNPSLRKREVILAEEVNKLHSARPLYENLLDLEEDLAQLCDLIILFSESAGSIAELGSFVMSTELSKKLLVVMRDYYYVDDSFIKLGPVKKLTNSHGQNSLYILPDDETGMHKELIANMNPKAMSDRLNPAIDARFIDTRDRTTLNTTLPGHVAKVAVGLVQLYGGLTSSEIVSICKDLNIDTDEKSVEKFLLCAEAANWVKQERRGANEYYFALPTLQDALILRFKDKNKKLNNVRLKEIYRDHWKSNGDLRFNGITKFARAGL